MARCQKPRDHPTNSPTNSPPTTRLPALRYSVTKHTMPYLTKIVLSVVMVLAISETTKRFGFWGSLLASLPVLSVISMIWIYTDTKDIQKISAFSTQVFWFILPSVGLFLTLPCFLSRYSFYLSLTLSCLVTIGLYLMMLGIFRLLRFNPL